MSHNAERNIRTAFNVCGRTHRVAYQSESHSSMTNRTIVLRSRPSGKLRASDFAIIDVPLPSVGEGQVLVRNLFGSLDPGTRKLFGEADGYIEPIPVGAPVSCLVLGSVVETRDPRFPANSLLVASGALQEYSVVNPGPMTWAVVPDLSASLSNHMSVLGAAGLTAYFGLLDVAKPQPGETVLISAAAGAVGSIAGQIARLKGCTVIGIAGGLEKCARLIDEFRFAAAIDYRGKDSAQLTQAIRGAAPQGIDLYFDNVGGAQLDAALACMNWRGRISACGMISEYDSTRGSVLRNLFQIIAKNLTMQGFLVYSYAERFPAAAAELAAWVRSGEIAFRERIEEGLDEAIPGFLRLFDGGNEGKSMVRIADH